MENENELNLDNVEIQAEEKLKVKNRFEKLSEKVISTAKERDDAQAKAKAEADTRQAAERDRDFYKDFSSNVSKYPAASQFQDKILEKVRSGYSTEDAMVSVLAREGKLSTPAYQQPIGNVEGGSAPTNMGGPKSVQDMSSDERLSALSEADKSGELARALLGK